MNNSVITLDMESQNERKQFFKKCLGSNKRCLSSAHGQLWTWKKMDQNQDFEDKPIKMYSGLISVVEDLSRNRSYHLQILCVHKGVCLSSFLIEDMIFVSTPEDFLDVYETKERMVCLNYFSIEEKELVKKSFDRITRKMQRLKKDPTYARRVEDICSFFEQMGIKESDTIDSKTRSFIYDFVQKKQITKTNHGCRSNGIEHNNGEQDKIDEILSEMMSNDHLKLRNSLGRKNSLKTDRKNFQVVQQIKTEFNCSRNPEPLIENKSGSIKRLPNSPAPDSCQHSRPFGSVKSNDRSSTHETQTQAAAIFTPKLRKASERKIPNKTDIDDDDHVDYAELVHDSNAMPNMMQAKAKFMQKVNENSSSVKVDTMIALRSQPPPIPPKLKRNDSRPDLISPIRM